MKKKKVPGVKYLGNGSVKDQEHQFEIRSLKVEVFA